MLAIPSQLRIGNRSLGYNASLVLTFLIAQASMMYTCYQAGRIDGIRESGAFMTEFPYTLNGLHILISLGLVISTLGLWTRRNAGLLISFLALVSVFGIYGFWRFMTVKYLSELAADWQLYSRVRNEVGFFHGATRWDLVILAFVAILLLWHLVRLTKMIRQAKDSARS